MKAPKIQNETTYDGRRVNGIVRWVFRYLDLDGARVMVKVKHKNGFSPYAGRFYQDVHNHGGYVFDRNRHDWKEVAPNVPYNIDHLIVCRIQKPGSYPKTVSVYERKDVPEPWVVENWQEALVSITAHEAMHLRQYLVNPKGNRYNESQTEWAAFRLWREWTATH